MSISLQVVENLAPDQASLTAAKKLLKPAKWSSKHSNGDLFWAHCQGSGANPYKTVIDKSDHGYKCTCPSRKFPCKHSLALMWMYAESDDVTTEYTHADLPDWVSDWLSRRRPSTAKANNNATKNANNDPSKSISLANANQAPIDPEEELKKQQANAKRALQNRQATDTVITQGMIEYEQWLGDQLRTGLGKLLDNATDRCRKISARLVDAKATTLAGRLDELPAKLLNAHQDMRLRVATNELAKTVWLIKAWQSHYQPQSWNNEPTSLDDPIYHNQAYIDVRRAINSYENKNKLLENPKKIEVTGIWQVVAEHIETRKDGLISHATWLQYKGLQYKASTDKKAKKTKSKKSAITDNPPQFALLLDYYPVGVGYRETVNRIGDMMMATVTFYPSRYPLRAIISDQQSLDSNDKVLQEINDNSIFNNPHSLTEFIQQYQQTLALVPWLETMPVCLPKGRLVASIATKGSKHAKVKKSKPLEYLWWQSDDGSWQLPLLPQQDISESDWTLLLASELEQTVIFWDGVYAKYGSSQTAWGVL